MDLTCMKDSWPSGIVSRSEVKRFTGGLFSPNYMKKLDSMGKGPKRIRISGKIVYKVDDLIDWLQSKMEVL